MEVYDVGGAVRDELMGVPSKDRDKVVVGATPAEMLAKGFKQVGKDFPVFLCPETQDEYALARTERKSGTGYHGFLVNTENVTLEEDLGRRDLTINAIAKDMRGTFIDPYNGQMDIRNKMLRHVSEAFAEDPLRVLRVARFLARFGPKWSVAPETMKLMHSMVAIGELDALTPERIWKEISRGLTEPSPLLMTGLLQDLGLFSRPVMADYAGVHASVTQGFTSAVQAAADAEEALEVVFALAFPRSWTREEALASRIPAEVRDVAELAKTMRSYPLQAFQTQTAEMRMQIVERLDPVRQTKRCELVLRTLTYTHPEGAALLRTAVERLCSVDVKAITQSMPPGPAVGQAIRAARLAAVAAA